MDASAFEIASGLAGIQAEEPGANVSDTISNDDSSKTISNEHVAHSSTEHISRIAKNDKRYIARDWFNEDSERDCDLMQIFIHQLNSTNHVNYSKAYILFKEKTGFPFSDPKHMRKRMDQIVYTFKNKGDMLPQKVKTVIAEYNNALEAAKQRDSSNRKRLSVMEPVEIDYSSDEDGALTPHRISGSHLDHGSSSHLIKKRRAYGVEYGTAKSIKRLSDNIDRLTKMMEAQQDVLNSIVKCLEIKVKDPVLHLNSALNVSPMEPSHDSNVYSEAHVNDR